MTSRKRKKSDKGHEETDEILKELEKRISILYGKASKTMIKKLQKTLAKYSKKDQEKRLQMELKEITEKQYKDWRLNEFLLNDEYIETEKEISKDMIETNNSARKAILYALPIIYAINRNYATYTIESQTGIDLRQKYFTDKDAESHINRNKKDFVMPEPQRKKEKEELDRKRDKWNKQHINSAVIEGINKGESIPKIAKRLQEVEEMDERRAVTLARTMTTAYENRARIDSYREAELLGIEIDKTWMATLDDRTRHEHRLLDGQTVPLEDNFRVEDEEIFMPGDPDASPHMRYNCRCTLTGLPKGFKINMRDLRNRRDKLNGMSYDEWKHAKEKKNE